MDAVSNTTLAELAADLGDPLLGEDERIAALLALEAAGLAAVPHLVERWMAPDAFFAEGRRVDAGPLYDGPPLTTATSVRFEIEALLYRLVTPPDAVTPGLGPGAPASPPPPFIDDWGAWWADLAGASLEVIREDARRRLEQAPPSLGFPVMGRAARPGVPVPPPAETPAEADRAAYAEGRRLFEVARSGGPDPAESELARIAEAHPRVARHVARWRRALAAGR